MENGKIDLKKGLITVDNVEDGYVKIKATKYVSALEGIRTVVFEFGPKIIEAHVDNTTNTISNNTIENKIENQITNNTVENKIENQITNNTVEKNDVENVVNEIGETKAENIIEETQEQNIVEEASNIVNEI